MSRFVQIHALTFYPPCNLNRDDTGRPKTAMVGKAERQRLSSQAQKRAWRTSEVFETLLEGHLGKRTSRFGDAIAAHLINEHQAPAERANEIACAIAKVFGKIASSDEDTDDEAADNVDPGESKKGGRKAKSAKGSDVSLPKPWIAQLAFISPDERQTAFKLAESLLDGTAEDDAKMVKAAHVLQRADTAVDIAMFGRMLTAKGSSAEFNREAAVQVAHAITTHQVTIEDDYFTAVDELKTASEDSGGAAHLGEAQFGSGVFYLYVCVDTQLLIKNLNDDVELAQLGLDALVQAIATVTPSGRQASFGSRAYTNYMMVEAGQQQPRSLAVAFVKPVEGKNQLADSIAKIEAARQDFEAVYGKTADARCVMNMLADGDKGSFAAIRDFIKAACVKPVLTTAA